MNDSDRAALVDDIEMTIAYATRTKSPSDSTARRIVQIMDSYNTTNLNGRIWETWDNDYDVSDAFQEFMVTMDPDPNEIVEFALMHLLGPRPTEQESHDE